MLSFKKGLKFGIEKKQNTRLKKTPNLGLKNKKGSKENIFFGSFGPKLLGPFRIMLKQIINIFEAEIWHLFWFEQSISANFEQKMNMIRPKWTPKSEKICRN